MQGLIGKKLGMTQVFTEDGTVVPVTVVEAGPCRVTALRTNERNGYAAVQMGFGQRKLKNVSKAVRTHVAAAGYTEHAPERIREFRLPEDPKGEIGDVIHCDLFAVDDYVDVAGITKGRGFQGCVRRHGFRGGRGSHGGDWHRQPGSIGMCEFPGKVHKGKRMPGQMGNVRRTMQNLKVVQVRRDENLILIKGSIPGPNGRHVIIKKARKKS